MGLDMYLERFPIVVGSVNGVVKALAPENFIAMTSWVEYTEYMKKEDEASKCTFREWCGSLADCLPDEETREKLLSMYSTQYYYWDTEHKHPKQDIREHIGYWRKANAVHNWFVNNIQGGQDDCQYHRAISKSELLKLREACATVLNGLCLKDGIVNNGYTFTADGMVPIEEAGKVASNTSVAEELLPTTSGYFFGSTDYDQYYASDLEQTVEIIDKVLETTDFNNQEIFYCSSW